jgi:hypothetical protein
LNSHAGPARPECQFLVVQIGWRVDDDLQHTRRRPCGDLARLISLLGRPRAAASAASHRIPVRVLPLYAKRTAHSGGYARCLKAPKSKAGGSRAWARAVFPRKRLVKACTSRFRVSCRATAGQAARVPPHVIGKLVFLKRFIPFNGIYICADRPMVHPPQALPGGRRIDARRHLQDLGRGLPAMRGMPGNRPCFRVNFFYREDFIYLCDELFTLGKMSSRSWSLPQAHFPG